MILTDFMMPFLDGAGLIAAIRDDAKLKDIPVVVMTSLREEALRERARGYRAYLRKPFREADLMRVLDEIFPKES